MRSVLAAGGVFFPLDEELGLLGDTYSPLVHARIVRLGALLPFERVADELAFQSGVQVSRETARRLTEQAGAALVAAEEAALRAVQRREVPMPAGVRVQQLSADGGTAAL